MKPRACTRFLLLITILPLGNWGCSTKIPIRSLEPGPIAVGPATHLRILDGEGRRSAREVVFQELESQCRAHGYFSVSDESEDGIQVLIAGRTVRTNGGDADLASDQAGLRVDVLEWNMTRDQKEVTTTDKAGKKHVKMVRTKNGNCLLAVTLFDPEGRTYLAETEYEGIYSTTDKHMDRDQLLELAARNAVHKLLGDITPVAVVRHVRLDTDDPEQKSIIEMAKKGSVAQAARDARHYLEANPQSASAAYNLAVFLDAMGQYTDAMVMYDRAMAMGYKDYYSSARAGCASRLSAMSTLVPVATERKDVD